MASVQVTERIFDSTVKKGIVLLDLLGRVVLRLK
jgi:hypothetical protein